MNEKTSKERNLSFFEANLEVWLKDPAYHHKYVVIHDAQVAKVFDEFSDALNYATSHFSPEEFIIQQVISDDEQIGFLKLAL